MEKTMVDVIPEGQTTVQQQIVDRGRRYKFISGVTKFCLIMAGLLSIISGFGWFDASPLVELYVRSLLTLAISSVMAYLTGSVIDYNGGVGNMFSSNSRNVTYSNNTRQTTYGEPMG
jgi:hypothetical protein